MDFKKLALQAAITLAIIYVANNVKMVKEIVGPKA